MALATVWMLVAGGGAVSCSSSSHPAATDGAADRPVDSPVTEAGGERLDGPADVSMSPPSDVTFIDPPPMACSGDGGGTAGGCDFPTSNCSNNDYCDDAGICSGGRWIVYYDNPRCQNGHCVWDRRFHDCGAVSYCSRGACRTSFTAP